MVVIVHWYLSKTFRISNITNFLFNRLGCLMLMVILQPFRHRLFKLVERVNIFKKFLYKYTEIGVIYFYGLHSRKHVIYFVNIVVFSLKVVFFSF